MLQNPAFLQLEPQSAIKGDKGLGVQQVTILRCSIALP